MLTMRPMLRQIAPAATLSVFPAVDIMLEDTEYQKALKYVAFRKHQKRYHSMVDFLFAELMGGRWKALCFRYYENEGPPLKNHPEVTKIALKSWEKQLCLALRIAWHNMDKRRTQSWSKFHCRWRQELRLELAALLR